MFVTAADLLPYDATDDEGGGDGGGANDPTWDVILEQKRLLRSPEKSDYDRLVFKDVGELKIVLGESTPQRSPGRKKRLDVLGSDLVLVT